MKYKDIPILRTELWKEQNHNCLLCGQLIQEQDLVLDHSHRTGHIRGVLHKGCNVLLGHIENNLKRNRIDEDRLIGIMNNLINYIGTEREEIHPIHLRTKRKKKTNICKPKCR